MPHFKGLSSQIAHDNAKFINQKKSCQMHNFQMLNVTHANKFLAVVRIIRLRLSNGIAFSLGRPSWMPAPIDLIRVCAQDACSHFDWFNSSSSDDGMKRTECHFGKSIDCTNALEINWKCNSCKHQGFSVSFLQSIHARCHDSLTSSQLCAAISHSNTIQRRNKRLHCTLRSAHSYLHINHIENCSKLTLCVQFDISVRACFEPANIY